LWSLDENTGTTAVDGSGNGRNGSITGATWAAGVRGSALEFDGSNDFISIPGGEWLTQPVGTVEAWIKIHPDGPGGRIISTETAGWHDGLHISYADESSDNTPLNGGISCGIHSTYTSDHYAEAYISNVSKGDWHFVAFVWNAPENTVLTYVDGQIHTVTTPHAGIADTGEPLTVGCWESGNSRGSWFRGWVDEIKFYDRALSTKELDEHRSSR
jgi:hypothetical protein